MNIFDFDRSAFVAPGGVGEIFVTKLIAAHTPPFDPFGTMAHAAALKRGVSVDEIRREWNEKAENSKKIGEELHRRTARYVRCGAMSDVIGDASACDVYIEPLVSDGKFSAYADLIVDDGKELRLFDFKFSEKEIFKDYGRKLVAPFEKWGDSVGGKGMLQLAVISWLLGKQGRKTSAWLVHFDTEYKFVGKYRLRPEFVAAAAEAMNNLPQHPVAPSLEKYLADPAKTDELINLVRNWTIDPREAFLPILTEKRRIEKLFDEACAQLSLWMMRENKTEAYLAGVKTQLSLSGKPERRESELWQKTKEFLRRIELVMDEGGGEVVNPFTGERERVPSSKFIHDVFFSYSVDGENDKTQGLPAPRD
ncbi:MAG: hypothetical protein RMM53_01255 [Bacteroidia bacterium]|nr:hypothetical protein [Bacteroidia bacterium]MDW8332821.1 hypothetical protein [Bacteroidia bacterium]